MDERVHTIECRAEGEGDHPIFLDFNQIKIHKEVECYREIQYVSGNTPPRPDVNPQPRPV